MDDSLNENYKNNNQYERKRGIERGFERVNRRNDGYSYSFITIQRAPMLTIRINGAAVAAAAAAAIVPLLSGMGSVHGWLHNTARIGA